MTGRMKFLPPDCTIIPPFACHEILYHDVHGEEKVILDVWLLPSSHTRDLWPDKRYFPVTRLDTTNGLPMMCWREWDHTPHNDSNAGTNWAPRACFIWRSKSENQPPLFVNISFDRKLPKFFTIYSILGYLAALCVLGLVFAPSDRLIGMFVMSLATYLFLALAIFGISINSALLIDKISALLIWRVFTPLFIMPKVHVAPWTALEGFEIKHDAKPDNAGAPGINRMRIRASFGRTASETDVLNGTWHEDDVREFHRLLTCTFLDRRQYYLTQMREKDEARARKAEANATLPEAAQLKEKIDELHRERNRLIKNIDALRRQSDDYFLNLAQTGLSTPERAELLQKAGQCDIEIQELLVKVYPLGKDEHVRLRENAFALDVQSHIYFVQAELPGLSAAERVALNQKSSQCRAEAKELQARAKSVDAQEVKGLIEKLASLESQRSHYLLDAARCGLPHDEYMELGEKFMQYCEEFLGLYDKTKPIGEKAGELEKQLDTLLARALRLIK